MRILSLPPLLALSAFFVAGQTQTVGLLVNDAARTSPGYTLLLPMHSGNTYLIDNAGQVVHSWNSGNYEPGRMAYLMPNGHLMRADSLPGQGPPIGGGDGGRIREYDWDGNVVWTFTYATSSYALHHDFKPLPNGNVIALLVETKTPAQMAAAGMRPDILQTNATNLYPDAVVEIEPIKPSGGKIVWEWHVWDHLVQNYDSSKLNYGTPSAHPELVDPNASYPSKIAAFWNHMNSVDYSAAFDQIILSVRGSSEVWVIDHSTTTAEAAAHTGGKYGKGGDLLYRWGNPALYGQGKSVDRMLYEQHDAQWIAAGRTGAGNIIVYSNGENRPGGEYTTVDEFAPPVDGSGVYALSGAYGPKQMSWSYAGTGSERFYTRDIGGAERLPNGNTLICYGTLGLLEEVTAGGEIVWKYISPEVQGGILTQGQSPALDAKGEGMNAVFKARRYAPDYPGLVGRDLTPRGPVEKYAMSPWNGASLQAGATAPGAVLSVFGSGLANKTEIAVAAPLPATLGGATAQIKDSAGTIQTCSLLYASPAQINLVVPATAAAGSATLTISRTGGASQWALIEIEAVAPGLFSVNNSGKGVGVIDAARTTSVGKQSKLAVFTYDLATKQFVSVPIDLGATTDQVALSLYATGVRGASSISAISATVGGVAVPVTGVSQSAFPGLDVVNVGPLPRALAGKGESNIVLQVSGRTSNTVTVNIK